MSLLRYLNRASRPALFLLAVLGPGSIIIATAATLFAHGIRVETAKQVALALAPVAGSWAELLFGLGLLGASLLAASVLPLATTYAVCEVFGWERGLDHRPKEAPIFYQLYTALVVLSALIVLIPGLRLLPLDVALSGGQRRPVARGSGADVAPGQ